MIVILHMCQNAPSESIDSQYFSTLPICLNHLPAYFSDNYLRRFGPVFPIERLAKNIRIQASRAFSSLQVNPFYASEIFPPTADFVLWSVCILNSRCFLIQHKVTATDTTADAPIRCLIPVADMFNHSSTANMSHEVNEDGSLSFLAARDILAGEELNLRYRDDNDAAPFLLNYGFLPQDSDMKIYFRVALDESSIRDGSRLRRAVESLGLNPSPDIALPASITHPLPALWIWLLRLKEMSEVQLSNFLSGQVEVSVHVESALWEEIKRTLESHRRWYLGENPSIMPPLNPPIHEHVEEGICFGHGMLICPTDDILDALPSRIRTEAQLIIAAAISEIEKSQII